MKVVLFSTLALFQVSQTSPLPRIVEEVIFKSCPTPLGKKQRAFPSDQMKPADRIERIVNDLFEFGVPIEVLFDVDDLLKAKNIPKVNSLAETYILTQLASFLVESISRLVNVCLFVCAIHCTLPRAFRDVPIIKSFSRDADDYDDDDDEDDADEYN